MVAFCCMAVCVDYIRLVAFCGMLDRGYHNALLFVIYRIVWSDYRNVLMLAFCIMVICGRSHTAVMVVIHTTCVLCCRC